MKTAQEILRESGIAPRRVIFDALRDILADSRWPFTDEKKLNKIVSWHKGLKTFDDERINRGVEFYLNSENDDIPSCGVFKKGCGKKVVIQEPKPFSIEFNESLKNIKKIKEKLSQVKNDN